MTKKFNAFTLAEVLITLGIIGVVAAMTMPTLINQTNGAQYKAAYKKALSAISQGVTLNVALDDVSFADTSAGQKGADATKAKCGSGDDETDCNTVGSILASRMNVVKASDGSEYTSFPGTVKGELTCTAAMIGKEGPCKTKSANDKVEDADITPDSFLFFNDSSMFAYSSADAKGCTSAAPCYGVIDVNGIKGPNKLTENADSPTDIYPVVFYDQTILPASEPAKAVLYGK